MCSILKSRPTRILSLVLAFLMLFVNISPSILACGSGSPGEGEYSDCTQGVDFELEDFGDFELDDYDWGDYSDFEEGNDSQGDDFSWDDSSDDAGEYDDSDDYEEWEDYEDIEDADDFDYDYDEDFDEDDYEDFEDGEVDMDDLDDSDVDIDEDFDFSFSEGGSSSCEGGSCGAYDSISGYSGNLHLKIDLFTLKTKGIPIPISLDYNSQATPKTNSAFGYKWKLNFDISLEEVEFPEWMEDHEDLMIRHKADGGAYYYEKGIDNEWLPPEGHHGVLERLADYSWVETMKNGVKYYFTSQGRLTKIETVHGNPVEFFYDGDGYIDYIKDCSNRVIDFDRDGGKIGSIFAPDGEEYSLSYTNGDLTRYEDPVGKFVDFTYSTSTHYLISRDHPADYGPYKVIYNYLGNKVASRVKEVGTAPRTYVRSLSYGANRVTTITDEGYKRKVVKYNDSGQTTKIEYYSYADGNYNEHLCTVKKFYGADGSLLKSDDGKGYRTCYRYNDRGDRITKRLKVKDASGIYVPQGAVHYEYYPPGHPNEHKLSMIRNARGNEVNYEYYGNDDLYKKYWTMTDHEGASYNLEETRTYYSNGLLETVKDPKDITTTYYYDDYGNMEEANKASGKKVTKYEYDIMGRKEREEELISAGRWKTIQYERDAVGRVTKVIYNDNPNDYGEFVYTCCRLDNSRDRDGNRTWYWYDPAGKLSKKWITISHDGGLGPNIVAVYKYTYDGLNRLVEEEDPNENTTYYDYDGLDRVTAITDAAGNVTEMEYDANSNLTAKTVYLEERAITTRMAYDYYNRLISVETPISATFAVTTYYSYDAGGNMVYLKDAQERESTFEYDEMGHLIASHEPMGKDTYYKYDLNGNLASIEDDLGRITTFSYDSLNRLTDIYKPIDSNRELHTKYAYDNIGNKTSVTLYDVVNWEDHTAHFEYNDDCRLTKITDPENKTIDYEYTYGGKLEKITDDNDVTTEYSYDQAGRNTRVVYALGTANQREEQYYYDGVGNLKIKKLRSGEQINYTYDALNRLDLKTYPAPDSRVIDYSYDDLGRMESVTMSGGYGIVGFEYDDLDRMTVVTYPDGKRIDYSYDNVGNRTAITYPYLNPYHIYTYSYDGLNRMDQVKYRSTLLVDYGYDPLRRIAFDRYLSNNIAKSHYGYNDADWLTYFSNELEGGGIFSRFTYAYDRVGNRTAMARDGAQNNDQYLYNKRYELRSVNYHQGSSFSDQTFNYDGVGNRETVVNGGTVTYTTDELNQYDTVGGVTHTYDLRGNLTYDGTNTYYYDLDNRLTGINGTISYEYDPFGRRIKKTVNGTVTNYVYDGDRVIEERDGADALLRRYVYGAGIDEVLLMEQGGSKYWYYYDALGSVVNISDNSGNLVSTIHYDVYGDFDETGSFTHNPYKFTGRRYDPESGLYFYRARMYSPELGRFLQTDPVGYVDGPNLYTYCSNRPIGASDPYGLFYFAKRPLNVGSGYVWNAGDVEDLLNWELVHEHGFFEDKPKAGEPDNVGFRPSGRFYTENRNDYRFVGTKHYDDALMREALNNVQDGKYHLLFNNCQHWCTRLRWEYGKLKRRQSEMAEVSECNQ